MGLRLAGTTAKLDPVRRIGPYELREELGRGATAAVFVAVGPEGKRVALKLLLPNATDQQRRRFRREAQALLRLEHPGIVRISGAGQDPANGILYIAMDLVPGGSLQDRLDQKGPFKSAHAAELTRDVARALAYAHELGILHRDIKPANVLLPADGKPLLTDFGLVHDAGADQSQVTRTGLVLGSPGYWPPEQARGDRTSMDVRSDVYALGATLFALLTGAPPFVGKSLVELVIAAASQAPPAPSSLASVDPVLDAIVLRCLAKAPSDRFPSAVALADVLDAYLDGEPVSASTRLGRRRSLGRIAGAAVAVIAVAGGLAGWVTTREVEVPEPDSVSQGSEPEPAPAPEPEPEPEPEPSQTPPTETEAPSSTADLPEATARVNRGVYKQKRGDLRGAFAEYTAAIELAPDMVEAYSNRGTVLEALGDFEAAYADYDMTVRLVPEAPRSWFTRGTVLLCLGKMEEAIPDFDRAIELAPRYADAYVNRANAFIELRRFRECIADFTRALKLDPSHKQAWRGRGRAKQELADNTGALADLDRAIALDANYSKAIFDRGLAYLALGRNTEARLDLEHFLVLEPDRPEARRVRVVLGRMDSLKD